jgi:hypothetical protein
VIFLLLVAALVCEFFAAIPPIERALNSVVGWVAFGWAGMFFFFLWLLAGGAAQLLAFVQRSRSST